MKNIFCDIGGVLLDVNFDLLINKLCKKVNINRSELNDLIFISGKKDKHDSGKLTSCKFFEDLNFGKYIDYDEFQDIWCDIFSEKSQVIDFILSLKMNFNLYLASNTDPLHFSFFLNNYNWIKKFDGKALSYELNHLKPSVAFFQKLCKKFSIIPCNSVFIDDSEDNIRTAISLGFKGHLFKDINKLKVFMNNEDN